MQTFDGFEARDFEAYAPQKWQSNVYNLERMRVKDKLVALGQALSPVQPSADGAPLSCEVSVEHPALWNNNSVADQTLYITRSEDERQELFSRNTRAKSMSLMVADPSPYREHICLCVVVHEKGLDVALRLHPNAAVDRQNTLTKLADRWHMQSFADLVTNLPDGFTVGLSDESTRAPAELDADALRELLQRFERKADTAKLSLVGDASVFGVQTTYAADDETLRSAGFVDRAREDIARLLPLYHLLAWSRQNDFVEVKEAIKEEKKAKKARGLAKNDRVKVTKGLFTGKTGVVEDLDAKGALKLRIGTMVVKVDAKDVTPAR